MTSTRLAAAGRFAAIAGILGACAVTSAPAYAMSPGTSGTHADAASVAPMGRSPQDAAKYPRFFPLVQRGTGPAQWHNCGPTSVVAAVYAMGKTPTHWDGMNDDAAVEYMRYSTMGVPHSWDNRGLGWSYVQRGFSAYGIADTYTQGSSAITTVLSAARSGRVSVISGDIQSLPNTYRHDIAPGTTAHVGHYIVVAGYEASTGRYLVIDPLSLGTDPASVVIHRFTSAQVNAFMASAPKTGQAIGSVTTKNAAPKPVPRVYGPTSLSGFGDFTGDGKSDLVGYDVRHDGGRFMVYPGTGKDSVGKPYAFGSGWNMYRMLVRADFNGDGKSDVLGVAPDGSMTFYAGNGHGGTGHGVKTKTSGWMQFNRLLAVGDLNGDGKNDLLGINPKGEVYFYAGTNGPGFLHGVRIATGWTRFKNVAAVGDITGDKMPDVVASDKSSGDLYLFAGRRSGTLVSKGVIGTGWNGLTQITGTGDFNGDGHNDLAGMTSSSPYALRLFKGVPSNATHPIYVDKDYGSGWSQFRGLF